MKIITANPRHGYVRLMVENLDDLWYLSQVVRAGDTVKTKSYRRVKEKDDKLRSSGGERKLVTLTIKVENTEFKSDTRVFRISGILMDGPQEIVSIGSHHTFSVDKGDILTITKEEWTELEFERLKDAEKSEFRPKLLIVVMDEGEANVGLVHGYSLRYFDITKPIGGKHELKGRKHRKDEFYREVAQFLEQIIGKEEISKIILAGPGFEKDNFLKFLVDAGYDFSKDCVTEGIGSSGRSGIREVMKKPIMQKMMQEASAIQDVHLVDEILAHIGRETGLAVYALPDVQTASESGALVTLALTDRFFYEKRNEIQTILKKVKSSNGRAHIVNREGEAGQQLESLGGIAGILRFRIQ